MEVHDVPIFMFRVEKADMSCNDASSKDYIQ